MMTVVFMSSTLRMLLLLCRWKKEERKTLLTHASIVKCSSKMAQRLRAEGDRVIGLLLSSIILSLMLERGPTVGVSNSNERVFSSFVLHVQVSDQSMPLHYSCYGRRI